MTPNSESTHILRRHHGQFSLSALTHASVPRYFEVKSCSPPVLLLPHADVVVVVRARLSAPHRRRRHPTNHRTSLLRPSLLHSLSADASAPGPFFQGCFCCPTFRYCTWLLVACALSLFHSFSPSPAKATAAAPSDLPHSCAAIRTRCCLSFFPP